MAVFRIEKTRDYTVMSNHHLKDRTLTLKSKGLLSMMLSLPDEWNYTTRGLAAICREGVDSIGAALKELENHGYIRRTQLRDEKGKITDTEYVIYEMPQCEPPSSPGTPLPGTAKPYTENPDMGIPDTAEPCTENPAQLNTNQPKTDLSSTELSNPIQSNPPTRHCTNDEKRQLNEYSQTRKKNTLCDILHTEAYPKLQIGLGLNLLQ